MPRIVVHVMPKPEILDPQGKAVASALHRLGYTAVDAARQGKRFELTVSGEVTDQLLETVREAAVNVLSNPVIEDVVAVDVEDEDGSAERALTEEQIEAHTAEGIA